MNAQEPERRGPAIAAAAAVASHATALGGGYVWLDHAHLEDGLALVPLSDVGSLFQGPFAGTGFYRPLMAVSLSLDAAISKTPAFFHAVTVGWHAAAAFLTTVTARALGLTSRAALVAGLLVAVHPTTSVVASAIAFRSEAMIAVFLLLLVTAHVRRHVLGAALALLAGALTKETAWVLGPLFIVALEAGSFLSGAPPLRDDPARRRLLGAEALALLLATTLRMLYAPPFRARHVPLSLSESLGTRLAATAKSAGALILPLDRTICDVFPVTSVLSLSAFLGALALAWVAWLAVRRKGTVWLFALALLPSLQLVPVMRWWSPHYLYVPLVFAAMLAGEVVDLRVRALTVPLAIIGLPLAALSLREGLRYENDAALWRPEVDAEPACREGQFYLGEVAREARDWDAAAACYERAATPVPGYLSYADELSALQNLGAVRIASEHWDEARAAWSAALERVIDPEEKRRILHNLAALALRTGNPGEAVRLLESERTAEHPLPQSLLVLARALHDLGREAEAREVVEIVQRIPR